MQMFPNIFHLYYNYSRFRQKNQAYKHTITFAMLISKKISLFIASFCILTLISAGCSTSKPNTLKRPIGDNTNANSEIAGAEITALPTKNITVANQALTVEIADNDSSRVQGLSGRQTLDEGTGLLFDFTNTPTTKPGFWMKDMNFNIDIIWINTGKIIGIEANAPVHAKDDELPVYYPPTNITHALEVPAGWSTKNNIVVGENVTL